MQPSVQVSTARIEHRSEQAVRRGSFEAVRVGAGRYVAISVADPTRDKDLVGRNHLFGTAPADIATVHSWPHSAGMHSAVEKGATDVDRGSVGLSASADGI